MTYPPSVFGPEPAGLQPMSEFFIAYFPTRRLFEIVMPPILHSINSENSLERSMTRKKCLQVGNAIFAIAVTISVDH